MIHGVDHDVGQDSRHCVRHKVQQDGRHDVEEADGEMTMYCTCRRTETLRET